jgi:iron(III) transport system substrate-binding protein
VKNAPQITRRTLLGSLAAAASLPLLAACGGQAAPASSPSGAGPRSAPAGDWQQQWNSWIEGAKEEGTIVFGGPPSADARTQIPAAFKQAFGVDMQYIGGPSSDLANRLRSEITAGQPSVDVTLSGADTTYLVLYGEHMTQPVKPYLIHPEALDPKAWRVGKVWYMDPEEQFIVRASNYTSQQVWANTDFIDPDPIKSWHDLLKPDYKGKIAAYDPVKNGSGAQLAAFLWTKFGPDFTKQLYLGQGVKISQDYTQLSDWLARGIYPIIMAPRGEDTEKLKKDGFKVKWVGPFTDAAGTVSAGFGLTNFIKDPPHPNAAKLFLNWILMKDGQIAWNKSQATVSVRTDVDNSWLTEDIVPKPGLDYFDTYDWDYTLHGYPKANAAIKQILGQ